MTRISASVAGWCMSSMLAGLSANAATLTVNSNLDAGGACPGVTCTLRQAIAAAATGDTINVDANGQSDALSDGLMLIRYLFGLRGNSLIAGTVGTGATRTTSTQIEAYIQTLMP